MALTPYFFALICMLCWGLAPLSGKAGLAKVPPFAALLIRSFAVSAILLAGGLLGGQLQQLPRIDARSASYIVLEGVLASLLGQLAYYYALKYGAASRVIPIASAFPVVAFVGALLLFGEKLTWPKGVGMGLIVAGILLLRR